jgi:hypothetical protein
MDLRKESEQSSGITSIRSSAEDPLRVSEKETFTVSLVVGTEVGNGEGSEVGTADGNGDGAREGRHVRWPMSTVV